MPFSISHGYVSGSVHEDSSVPHDAVALEDPEQDVEGIFDNASGWYGYQDYYNLPNGYQLDYDGYATKLIKY